MPVGFKWPCGKSPFLFAHKALAKAFRGKLKQGLVQAGLHPPATPDAWVVDVKPVGVGDKALRYLARYLYRGVIREQDILASEDGQVTFRYRDAKTNSWATRTLAGADFLWLVLQHTLPKAPRAGRHGRYRAAGFHRR
jgi:hypothetical protein